MLHDALPFIIMGIVLATLVDTLGTIASRKFNFNAMNLSVLSFLIYTLCGYHASKQAGLQLAMVTTFVIGLYEATIGLAITLALKPNTGLDEEGQKLATNPLMIPVIILFTMLFGFIGHLIA